ncbi:hypothetical protein A33M_2852 [Rhodovulum sp. PH10]|nr:hypothetical protein A33M_2852 [Rhodovulum sp. PH10]
MAGGPPRSDTIDQYRSVGEHDTTAESPRHRKRCRGRFHLGVGKPHVRPPFAVP